MLRQGRLRQIGAITALRLAVRAEAQQTVDEHHFTVYVMVEPSGGSPRAARAGEVTVRLQDNPWWSGWRTVEEALTDAEAAGHIFRPRLSQGRYRVTAEHLASTAEVAREFDVAQDGTVVWADSQALVRSGNQMAAGFRQDMRRDTAFETGRFF